MDKIRLYHNPRCSTSRKVLEMIRDAGHEPEIIDYLKTPPSAEELLALAAASGESIRALLRTKQAEYLELGLDNPALSEAQLAAAIAATPVLLNRPVVHSARGARTCRPVETVYELLPED